MSDTNERLLSSDIAELSSELSSFLNDALEAISTVESVNQLLDASDIDDKLVIRDLMMRKAAEVATVDNVDDVVNRGVTNNFPEHFVMFTGYKSRNVGGQIKNLPVPVTSEEMVAMRYGNEKIGRGKSTADHRDHPNFRRMLTIFPNFAIPLTVDISTFAAASAHTLNRDAYRDRFKQELFVAYQIMSKLVDQRDLNEHTPDWYMKV
jgi:hypothetical protein